MTEEKLSLLPLPLLNVGLGVVLFRILEKLADLQHLFGRQGRKKVVLPHTDKILLVRFRLHRFLRSLKMRKESAPTILFRTVVTAILNTM